MTTEPLGVSFDEVQQALAATDRWLLEPDGSFVWVSRAGEEAWQMDGNLVDRGDRLQWVELHGGCTPEALDRLLGALGWPAAPLMFQLVPHGLFLDEAEFRRWAARAAEV